MKAKVVAKFKGDSTVSIRLAISPDDATTARILIAKANEALIKAKLQGKNNIHFAENRINKGIQNRPTILIVDDDNLASIEYILFSLARTVEAKDEYTKGHVERVSKLAIILGRNMGLTESEMEALRFRSILHDIGKITIPEYIY